MAETREAKRLTLAELDAIDEAFAATGELDELRELAEGRATYLLDGTSNFINARKILTLIERLRSTARAGAEDTVLLDWLENERCDVVRGCLGNEVGWWCYDSGGYPVPPTGSIYPTARAAIRAARASSAGGSET